MQNYRDLLKEKELLDAQIQTLKIEIREKNENETHTLIATFTTLRIRYSRIQLKLIELSVKSFNGMFVQ